MAATILSLRYKPLNIEHNGEVVTGLSWVGAAHGRVHMAGETDICHRSPETHFTEEAAVSTRGATVGRLSAARKRQENEDEEGFTRSLKMMVKLYPGKSNRMLSPLRGRLNVLRTTRSRNDRRGQKKGSRAPSV